MKKFSLAVAALLAAAVFSPSAQAQCVAAPLQSLAGTWTFSFDGFQFPPTLFLGAAGRLTATVNAAGRGILSITATSSIDGSPVRLETDAGYFQVDDDCTGGSLQFNLSSRPVQFEFYFVNPDEIVFVGNTNRDVVLGGARRVVPFACPAQTLQALAGTWVFSFNGFRFPPTTFLASAGRFVATVGVDRGGNPTGVLALSVTSSLDGSPVRREQDAGRFQVNADCSGGQLIFNLSSRPVQFDFFFTSANTIVIVGTNNGDILVGSARRFGTI